MLFTGVIWLSLGFSMLVLSLCEEFLNIFGGVGVYREDPCLVPSVAHNFGNLVFSKGVKKAFS
jgi:hypothetical protein